MKRLLQVAFWVFAVSFITVGVYGQEAMQSKLNVGTNAQKSIEIEKSVYLFKDFPNKLNLNSKTDYTQFYRNLLLNQVDKKGKEDLIQTNNSTTKQVVEKVAEGVKFGKVFPNPADSYANIEVEVNTDFKSARIVIMNMVGEILQDYTISKDTKVLRINTGKFTTGIYMVQGIVDGKKVMTQKLLVDHN